MSQKKLSMTIYVDPEQMMALKTLSLRTRVPVAEYVREGIDAVLELADARGLIGENVLQPSVSLAPLGDRDTVKQRIELEGTVERVLRRLLADGSVGGNTNGD